MAGAIQKAATTAYSASRPTDPDRVEHLTPVPKSLERVCDEHHQTY